MIPKKIHYIWFGSSKLPREVRSCIASWKANLKDYEIHFWGEDDLELDCNFAKQAYKNKKWAFLSDYFRLKILYNHGGIYMDTDMLVLKSFDEILNNDVFFGKETIDLVNGAIIGGQKGSDFLKELVQYYSALELKDVEPIPIIISRLLNAYNGPDKIKIFSIEYFYPYPYDASYKYKESPIKYVKENTLALHLWHKSWKTDMHKFVRAGNYIGAMGALIQLILQNPTSLKLWRRFPGTIRLSLIQLFKLC